MADTGAVKSEDTPFEGGPMDGRVLPVLLGPTGHPPKTYRIPVPDAAGGPPTVLVYRRVPRGHSKRLGLHQGWKYTYDPEGKQDTRLKWPWSTPDATPDATPGGKRDDTDG
ncbi:hypothetical protein AB0H86_31375 [Streptomyces sp. NPDC050997]|uniref:hypothetical protein n=1 Tax=Streptomyces sp. NPDC050997 TaxID=3155519 RepID=UPI003439EA7C